MTSEPIPSATVRSGAPATPSGGADSEPPPGTAIIPTYRLYTRGQIGGATFLGGPTAGAWLLALNFSRLRQPRAARITMIAAVLAVGAMIALAVAVPALPRFAFSAASLAAIIGIARSTQGHAFDDHLAAGGRIGSGWMAAGIALINLAAIVAIIFAVALGMEVATRMPMVDFGDDHQVFYKDGASEADARTLGDALTRGGYFMPGHPASVVVLHDQGRKVVAFVVQDLAFDDTQVRAQFRDVAKQLSSDAYGGEPVDIWFDDATLTPHTKIHWGEP